MGHGPDRQHARRGLDVDLIRKPRNLQQRLGETDAPAVPDVDKLPSNHGDLSQACSCLSHL
jgi:uncharacterized protein YacL